MRRARDPDDDNLAAFRIVLGPQGDAVFSGTEVLFFDDGHAFPGDAEAVVELSSAVLMPASEAEASVDQIDVGTCVW